jgi:hypothetical protein
MVKWLRGEPLNSDQAVRTVVNPARAAREKISVKALRERVREALSDASGGPGELLPRAFEVAQARGLALGWQRVPLQQLKLLRQTDRSLAIAPRVDVSAIARMQQWVWFHRAFEHQLPSDSPISEITQEFDAVDAFIKRRRKRRRNSA